MQHDRSPGREIGQSTGVRARLARAAFGIALTGLLVGLGTAMARAGDGDSPWGTVLQKLGLSKPPASDPDNINYTERSPLVVPPTRDLPAPAAGPPPVPDWPKDPNTPGKRAKIKPGVVPDTAVQTPNPPVAKKPWYNPMGWFDKEEYANFKGEPVREDLTDPPAGYRVPSPDQPYGIGPEQKPGKTKPTSSDLNLGSATPPAGGQGGK